MPQKVLVVAPNVISSLQSPKSVNLMWPSESNSRFSSCSLSDGSGGGEGGREEGGVEEGGRRGRGGRKEGWRREEGGWRREEGGVEEGGRVEERGRWIVRRLSKNGGTSCRFLVWVAIY